MAYEIALTATARRSLHRIPEKAAHAVVEFMFGALADNPHRVGKPLGFELSGSWSARRSEYRVVYRIDDEEHLVTIDVIAHRSDVYRRR
jgi:mRNA-degrading endonuclease RelE of RelBE toxin-antitoxin system